ncbi:hypothetical protein SUGI_0670240 [Cryptomeria japonica]|nr:hypothetical protein SUGI_0670240 [Cryptomeria japonica]
MLSDQLTRAHIEQELERFARSDALRLNQEAPPQSELPDSVSPDNSVLPDDLHPDHHHTCTAVIPELRRNCRACAHLQFIADQAMDNHDRQADLPDQEAPPQLELPPTSPTRRAAQHIATALVLLGTTSRPDLRAELHFPDSSSVTMTNNEFIYRERGTPDNSLPHATPAVNDTASMSDVSDSDMFDDVDLHNIINQMEG